jgi:hypothetical protein
MLKTRKFFDPLDKGPDRPQLIHPWDMLPRRQLPGNPSRSREDDWSWLSWDSRLEDSWCRDNSLRRSLVSFYK